jgi:adenylate kinase family enzyme
MDSGDCWKLEHITTPSAVRVGPMNRVLIVGCAGAGKTTLARKLATVTRLPVIHLDRHYWQAGWKAPDKKSWAAEVAALTSQPFWIIDGHYISTLAIRLAAADTVIHLDYPTWLCTARVFRRTLLNYGRSRDDMALGCPERFEWTFAKYVLSYRRKYRPRLLESLRNYEGQIFAFRSPGELNGFLNQYAAADGERVVGLL